MILDHINGVRDDNRIENLQIVCPNCAATLETHCGRSAAGPPPIRTCLRCKEVFRAGHARQKYCSRYCGIRQLRSPERSPAQAAADMKTRKVERPPFEVLIEQVERDGFSATGRRYGVSDTAIRKWLLWFEREAALGRGEDPPTLADIRRKYGKRRKIRE